MRNDLFPTPVWYIEGAPPELVDELYQGAYEFKKRFNNANEGENWKSSIQGGYQSPHLSWEEFHPQGIEYINKIVDDIAKEYGKEARVYQWWYNICGKGDWNEPHTHKESQLVAILFLTDRADNLTLVNPNSHRFNEATHGRLDVKKGGLIIFPSDILHYVKPNDMEEDRITISMNININPYG